VLLFLVLLAAVAGVPLVGGLTLSSALVAAAAVVIIWSIGAFVPTRRERRRG
jgi:hypothetical protein